MNNDGLKYDLANVINKFLYKVNKKIPNRQLWSRDVYRTKSLWKRSLTFRTLRVLKICDRFHQRSFDNVLVGFGQHIFARPKLQAVYYHSTQYYVISDKKKLFLIGISVGRFSDLIKILRSDGPLCLINLVSSAHIKEKNPKCRWISRRRSLHMNFKWWPHLFQLLASSGG